MTDIEQKAEALVNAVRSEMGFALSDSFSRDGYPINEVLCRAIEQHEAFRQKVSDVVYRSLTSIAKGCAADAAGDLSRFVIPKPKPDPLAQILGAFDGTLWEPEDVSRFRAALDAAGLEIREKNDD